MKKWVLFIAIVSVIINVILVYVFVFKGETASINDTRTTLIMSKSNKEFVFDEMRTFLESVQQINQGILENKPELVITAAQKSGGSVIAHAPKGMLKTLPLGFKQLGFATHDTFDAIAEDAKNNFNPNKTQQQLNTLLNKCTACHKGYKIEINN